MTALGTYRRLVIKIGSALLVEGHTPRMAWLKTLAMDLRRLVAEEKQVILVSSGAVALGRGILKIPPTQSLTLNQSQAAAAVGQITLARVYQDILKEEGLLTAQLLLTLGDTEERRHYLNARETLSTLLKMNVVPIINENDTVATSELRYGDNDRLAARVAAMISADCLVLLSDIDGLYTAPPDQNPEACFIETVPVITPEIEAMAGHAASGLSRGGMKTKIEAARIAMNAGVTLVLTSGKTLHPLQNLLEKRQRATWFPAHITPRTARKIWISSHLKTQGSITIDSGAVAALFSGKSLLPAGVRAISGRFSRGDSVRILSLDGNEIGRGLVGYDAAEAQKICGKSSKEISALLGPGARSVLIHRDDLALDKL